MMEPEKTRTLIAMLVIFGFLAVIAAWFVVPVKGDTALFNVLVGMLGTSFSGVISFYFASTSGSKAKDETIGNIAQGKNGVVPPAAPPASTATVTTMNRAAP